VCQIEEWENKTVESEVEKGTLKGEFNLRKKETKAETK